MPTTPTRTSPLAWLAGAAAVGGCCLLTWAILAGHLVLAAERVASRPVILHLGPVSLSAEITARPECAPLQPSIVCLVHQTDRPPNYLSIWVYQIPPPGPDRHMSSRPLLSVQLAPDEQW